MLERCLDSVAQQTVPCVHYVVSDGVPQDWIDQRSDVRHIRLSAPHSDYGNVARGLGAMHAVADGVAAISFLDADNYLDLNHAETCMVTARLAGQVDYVAAGRRLVSPSGEVLALREEPGHVDTSCFFLLRGAFHVISQWFMQPSILGPFGDRVFLARLKYEGLACSMCLVPTVNYLTLYDAHYQQAGLAPPQGAKPAPRRDAVLAWWGSLRRREQEAIRRALGLPKFDPATTW